MWEGENTDFRVRKSQKLSAKIYVNTKYLYFITSYRWHWPEFGVRAGISHCERESEERESYDKSKVKICVLLWDLFNHHQS